MLNIEAIIQKKEIPNKNFNTEGKKFSYIEWNAMYEIHKWKSPCGRSSKVMRRERMSWGALKRSGRCALHMCAWALLRALQSTHKVQIAFCFSSNIRENYFSKNLAYKFIRCNFFLNIQKNSFLMIRNVDIQKFWKKKNKKSAYKWRKLENNSILP